MKKQLLGSTALVAATMLAVVGSADAQQPTPGKITLQLGGYMNQFLGGSIQSNKDGYAAAGTVSGGVFGQGDKRNVDVQSDAEIYFLGKTTLDNGLTVGVTMELEVVGSPGAITDEAWAFVEGSWGQIRLGEEDPPIFLMHYGAPDAGLGLSYGFPNQWINPPNPISAAPGIGGAGVLAMGYDSPINSNRLRVRDDDAEKIVYYTPRIEGFQFGVSYTPQAVQDSTPATPTMPAGSQNYTDGWSLGLNFVRKFAPIDIALSAGYFTWLNNPKSFETAGVPYPITDEPQAYAFGANLGYAGFTFGVAYAQVHDLYVPAPGVAALAGTPNISQAGKSWEAGVQYAWGPSAVSIGYFYGDTEDSVAGRANPTAGGAVGTHGKDVQRRYQVSAGHRLGPGVAVKGSLFHLDWNEELAGPSDNAGWGLVGGLYLNF